MMNKKIIKFRETVWENSQTENREVSTGSSSKDVMSVACRQFSNYSEFAGVFQ